MANFHRDRDLNAFDARSDITAFESTTSRRRSQSPVKQSVSHEHDDHKTSISKDDSSLESLRKRMAGPSSSKAGLAVDQDEINRKIYEASKGSKYFENEKRSDERTTRQIEAMLSKRDEILRQFPEGGDAWQTTQRRIDEHVMLLEGQRDLSRIILHADMDMFYAAVELKRDPSLKGKAFGVGKGVLVTASYEARKMGCRSGMATHVALALCPHLIVVQNDMQAYVAASQEVMAIFELYDPNYAQMSLDEAYMDITPYCEMNGTTADAVVTELRESVQQKTGLTVSVGIAPNKMLAKISSDRNKPNGQFRVEPDRNFIIDLMQDLPCRKIPGIGRVTERILSSLGVNTCGDVWSARVMLHLTLGEIDWLLNAYLGIHSNVVEPSKREERKSVGREHTFRPTKDTTQLKEFLRQSAEQVSKDLQRLDFRGKCITLTCKTDAFRRFTRAKTMSSYHYKGEELFGITSKLLDAEIAARGGPFAMRLIGVRVSTLKDLREPEHGGIKKLFEQSHTSPQKRRSDAGDARQEQGNSEEEGFERAMQEALQRSVEEQHATLSSSSLGTKSVKRKIEESTSGLDSTCPICNRIITALVTDDIADAHHFNSRLNEHIDRCLEGQGDADVLQSPSELSPRLQASKNRKKNNKATLETFFRRRLA